MTKAGLTENMLRIYEGLKKEQRLESIIEGLINKRKEKPYRSEVSNNPIALAQRERQEI